MYILRLANFWGHMEIKLKYKKNYAWHRCGFFSRLKLKCCLFVDWLWVMLIISEGGNPTITRY